MPIALGLCGTMMLAVAAGVHAESGHTTNTAHRVARTEASSGTPAGDFGAVGDQRYELHLHHLHTGEDLDVVYRVGDQYIPGAIAQLNHFLRDHRTEDVSHYDPREFDVLHSVAGEARTAERRDRRGLRVPDAVVEQLPAHTGRDGGAEPDRRGAALATHAGEGD